ncbi:GNAT family N-acetyltransferase [Prosthecochloris sp. GSB1]|uniref:GNAT family N-acetyltransferase n=1 Tax=Prosthecochloris sp. GSB1 TaxID=281093 RepID=UPI000B8CAEEF|nr:GNAT family N-acetyltransferase [Prosthecochloris sp. GSB1]ASQ91669.1 GNAT family N-acetyltransferase [Prosthecochloris sp. GSB1]
MRVRSAKPEDIDCCTALLHTLFSQEAEFVPDARLQRRGLGMIVAEPSLGRVLVCQETKSGGIVGMVVLLFTFSTALGARVVLLEDMVVDPSYRSRGVGGLLLREAEALARSEGYERITLLTDGDNLRAQAFYEKNGYNRSKMAVFRRMLSRSE